MKSIVLSFTFSSSIWFNNLSDCIYYSLSTKSNLTSIDHPLTPLVFIHTQLLLLSLISNLLTVVSAVNGIPVPQSIASQLFRLIDLTAAKVFVLSAVVDKSGGVQILSELDAKKLIPALMRFENAVIDPNTGKYLSSPRDQMTSVTSHT